MNGSGFISVFSQDFLTVAQLIQQTAGLDLLPEPGLDFLTVGVGAPERLRKTSRRGQSTCVSIFPSIDHAVLSQLTNIIVGLLAEQFYQA